MHTILKTFTIKHFKSLHKSHYQMHICIKICKTVYLITPVCAGFYPNCTKHEWDGFVNIQVL